MVARSWGHMGHTDQNTAQRRLQVEVLGGEKKSSIDQTFPKMKMFRVKSDRLLMSMEGIIELLDE